MPTTPNPTYPQCPTCGEPMVMTKSFRWFDTVTGLPSMDEQEFHCNRDGWIKQQRIPVAKDV